MDNKEVIKKLKDLAYTYHPYGINFFDTEYAISPEALYLQETKKLKANLLKNNWDALVRQINNSSVYYNILIEDWTQEVLVDNCFKLVVILRSTDEKIQNCIRLVLNLSVLIPYYLIYQSIYSPESMKIHNGNYSSVSYNIPFEGKKYEKILYKFLKENFPEYSTLNQDIAEATIEEIMYNGIGNVTHGNSAPYPNLTIFNTFFTHHLL